MLAKLETYRAMRIEVFILYGCPHAAEADLFARQVCRIEYRPLRNDING